ncbi:hypothetical protein EB796_008143 [Bugula neritina]|uniref:Uncharacterized protein n=1 Tax=Bugula neritina TaxID=10212 RepID=A0A7J7K4I6_BUGNE|nr:hypothetical protein EB796_008143 [Bugula neritina]
MVRKPGQQNVSKQVSVKNRSMYSMISDQLVMLTLIENTEITLLAYIMVSQMTLHVAYITAHKRHLLKSSRAKYFSFL